MFSQAPGVVGAVVTGQALPFAVAIGGADGVAGFPVWYLAKAVLTGFDVAGQSGLGVAHTLRDRIYVYAFGERMGEAAVSGIAFAGTCDGPAASGGRAWTGFDATYAYYERVRVSTQGVPARLVFGPDTTLSGFLDGFQFRLADAQTGVGDFSFRFKLLPRLAAGAVRPLPWEAGVVPGIPLSTDQDLNLEQFGFDL